MAHGKRWTRAASGIALAATAGLAAAGCTAGTASTASDSAGAPGTLAALTTAQARQIFDSYVATSDKAARTDNAALALSDVTGVQQALVASTLKARSYVANSTGSSGQVAYRSSLRVMSSLAQYTYGAPTFYLPAQAGYPRFFIADVSRTLNGTKPADDMATWVGGSQVPVDGPVLMLFEQAGATAPWLLGSVSELAGGVPLPTLARDGAGLVPTVPLDATTLLGRPDVAGPLQAAVVDDGPASAAAKDVASGPLTTGMYQGARTSVMGVQAPPGDIYLWELDGANYPQFALRTANGGALVFYAMYLNTTVEVPAKLNDAEPVNPGPPITVPVDLLPLLPPGKTAPRVSLESQDLLSFAAVDPPTGSSKIQVIAVGGGLSYASAS